MEKNRWKKIDGIRATKGSSLEFWNESCTIKEINVAKGTCDELNLRHFVSAVWEEIYMGPWSGQLRTGEQVLSVKIQPWEPYAVDMHGLNRPLLSLCLFQHTLRQAEPVLGTVVKWALCSRGLFPASGAPGLCPCQRIRERKTADHAEEGQGRGQLKGQRVAEGMHPRRNGMAGKCRGPERRHTGSF